METMKRTVTCGELRADRAGQTVVLNGWVHRKRDHGGVTFINLRDRYGVTQVVVDTRAGAGAAAPDLGAVAAALRNEYCIAVEGVVRLRPEEAANPSMPTGDVEACASKIAILNRSEPPPFQIDGKTNAGEDLRLAYRYLDMRSESMQRRVKLRSDVSFAAREFMIGQGFYEIETPTFIKPTPEGARDYLVPSRLYAGKFYALPQSPQLYKQLLMAGGFDKYFQIARCYRDEDARGDRQPEFTQIDMEMSFVGRDDVLSVTERLMGRVFMKTLGVALPERFKRLTWEEAQERYGSDKPDLRFGMELRDFAPYVEAGGFQAFKDALAQGGGVKALVARGGAGCSRKRIEELEAHAKIYKAKGVAWMKAAGGAALEGGVAKFFAANAGDIITGLGATAGDLILIVADAKRKVANAALGAVRAKLGKDLSLADPRAFEFVWIVDFPLFEFNEGENRWEAAHHLFSHPKEQCLAILESDPGAVLGDLYDLVLNGCELASGSIRVHDPELQKRIFSVAGIPPEEAERKFGFLTNAFKYGAPPHGGIAAGLDRLVMLMAGETSIKEVIAFPKNSFAASPMDDCPGEVEQKQLDELHLAVRAP
ncbi:MAG: aspartate--tRNA ligase [Clostridiales bacterium]|nr:aspartate--tRNA ligase [Clostridiales bacterium]